MDPRMKCLVCQYGLSMGWSVSADLVQNFIRCFDLDRCGVPASLDLRLDACIPPINAVAVCMEGFDVIARL